MEMWKIATPIWSDDRESVNQYVEFQDTFELCEDKRKILLDVCVDGYYAIYVNGHYFEAQQYADYPTRKVYDSIVIPESYLKANERNQIVIQVHCPNESNFSYRKGQPFLLYVVKNADGELLTKSDSDTLYTTQTGFCTDVIEKVSQQIGYTFRYDEDMRDKIIWRTATEYGVETIFVPRPVPQLDILPEVSATVVAQGMFCLGKTCETASERIANAFLQHKTMQGVQPSTLCIPSEQGLVYKKENGADGVYIVIDLQAEQAGYFYLDCESKMPFQIDIGYGEHLDDLRVRTTVGGRNFANELKFQSGRKRFCYPFRRIAGRYLQLHVYAEEFTLYYAGIRPVVYPLKLKQRPEGLDHLQTKIYDTALHTLCLCMHEHFEDTPWREQALYAMDGRNQMLCSFCVSDDTNYGKENLRLLGMGIREDGFLELCAPAEVNTNIPCFSLIWILSMGEYVRHTGDVAFGTEMWETMKRVINTFMQYYKDGVLYNPPDMWAFYEWSQGLDGISEDRMRQVTRNGEADSPLNAFFVLALHEMIYIAGQLGKSEEALSYVHTAQCMKKGYRACFWDEQRQAYRLSTEKECRAIFPVLTQALTVCAELYATEEEKEQLLEGLTHHAFSPEITLSHRLFFYQALLKEERYRDFILQDVNENWGAMLFQGATSFWETSLGAVDFDYAGSLCHGWSAIPIYVYTKLIERKSS